MKSAISLIAILALFFLTPTLQASAEEADTEAKSSELFKTSWSLVSISTAKGDQALPEKHGISMSISDDGTVSGNSGVNHYAGSVKVDGNKLSWAAISHTKKFGEKALINAETLFLKSVAQTSAYELKDDTLVLYDENTKTKVILKKT